MEDEEEEEDIETVTEAAAVEELEGVVGSGLRLRFAAAESLSLDEEEELLEELLLEEEEEELELLELLSLRFLAPSFFARRARLFLNTNSKPSARSIARASSPRKGNFKSSCPSQRRAMCCEQEQTQRRAKSE